MKPNFDLSLYLVTDRELCLGRNLEHVVQQAVEGGITMLQLREKRCDSRTFFELAVRLKNILPNNIPLIINDRVDIAMAAKADGVHIGQNDLPANVVRKIMGNDAIIGLSIENREQALIANELDIDYIGISPVFSTPTKTDTAPQLGLDGVREISKISKFPAVAIGGIHADNITEIVCAGADGVAVVSAICSAQNPKTATEHLLQKVFQSKKIQ